MMIITDGVLFSKDEVKDLKKAKKEVIGLLRYIRNMPNITGKDEIVFKEALNEIYEALQSPTGGGARYYHGKNGHFSDPFDDDYIPDD